MYRLFKGGAMGIEEFQQCLHDVTSFPLRPFVLPYLRAYLPPLQKEIALQARNAKQVKDVTLFECIMSIIIFQNKNNFLKITSLFINNFKQ